MVKRPSESARTSGRIVDGLAQFGGAQIHHQPNDWMRRVKLTGHLVFVAMRTCNRATCSDPTFIFSDHLGSTSITTDVEGNLVSETRYDTWGKVRYASGLTPTDYTYTGQYSYMDDPTTAASEGFGLMFYNARWYDPGLGRFAQADTIVPPGVQGLDRYTYVYNNPINYTDPSGHNPESPVYLYVNLASSIPRNFWEPNSYRPAAQYKYTPDIHRLPSGHFNLCGDLSLSMILETGAGRAETLYDIYAASPSTRSWNEGTSSYEVAQQFAGSFPSGWSAVGVTYGEIASFNAGNPIYTSYVSNSPYGASNITSADALCSRFARMLMQGHYVIAGVTQFISDPSGGFPGLAGNGTSNSVGHWVVVTGIYGNYVYINNPYTNRRETYTRAEFYNSWRHSWIEITSPDRRGRPRATPR